jgi:hypothetical protein
MRLRTVWIAAALISGGCGTSEDVKKTGVVWQGAVAARYDQLAYCLSKQTTLYYKAGVKFDRKQQHATVTFLIPVTGIPVEVYDLRQTSDDVTEVTWSTRLERGRHKTGKPYYLMDQCGAALLPTGSLPAASPSPPPTSPPAAYPQPQPQPQPSAPASPQWAPEPAPGTQGTL